MKENPNKFDEVPQGESSSPSDNPVSETAGEKVPTDPQNEDDGELQLMEENDPLWPETEPAVVYDSMLAKKIPLIGTNSPPVAEELEGIAANGGAVGALVLGVWSILGSLLTHWSLINGILGLVMGFWGLTSKRPRIAWIGIILCVIGTVMSMATVSDMVANYWNAGEDIYNP